MIGQSGGSFHGDYVRCNSRCATSHQLIWKHNGPDNDLCNADGLRDPVHARMRPDRQIIFVSYVKYVRGTSESPPTVVSPVTETLRAPLEGLNLRKSRRTTLLYMICNACHQIDWTRV